MTAPTATLRVLVVEDDADVADSTAALLAFWGHTTRAERDPLRALQVADDFRPHAVLLDIGLPRMHGYDLARRLRERPWSQGTRLIAVTGWDNDADRKQSMISGIHHHLVKPVRPSVLEHILAGIAPVDHD